jgi:hypothetical protein
VPCTYTPSHEEWERLVLGAGYEFALFNEINRYYVAREHAGRKGQTPSFPTSFGPKFQQPPTSSAPC